MSKREPAPKYLIYSQMDEVEARSLSLRLMEVAEMAYLTTIDERGFPQTRAMENLRNKKRFPSLIDLFQAHKDDFRVLFGTHTSSVKVNQIKKNPAVSVYYCRPNEYCGLMLGGLMDVVTDARLKEKVWQPGWKSYYSGGVGDPEFTVLSLFPQRANYYQRRQICDFSLGGRQ